MTKINARRKGNAGEIEWKNVLNKAFGTKYARTPLSGGLDLKGDVRRTYYSKRSIADEFHWEVKRVESINVHKCLNQAIRDARGGIIPVVAFRRNSQDWRVCLEADDFINILLELEELRNQKGGQKE